MRTTAQELSVIAAYVHRYGHHTGPQLATADHDLRICAIVYVVTENCPAPAEFYNDETASIRLIECSAKAMAAIRAISGVLDSPVCEDLIVPGLYVPNYIKHVSNWAVTPGIGRTEPPTVDEIRARILRAANTLAIQTPITPAA